jgi:CheY-like chemotaxis protein
MTSTPNSAATSRKLNILLTQDNLVNSVLAQKLLQKFGHTVTLANNGKEGATVWEANQASQFDVILMDIQMQAMDGLQATAYICTKEKALETDSPSGTISPIHIPIVAMTAHAMKGDREPYLAGGMDGYVSKPINSAGLERVIQAVVDLFPFRNSANATVVENSASTAKLSPLESKKPRFWYTSMATPICSANWPRSSSMSVRNISATFTKRLAQATRTLSSVAHTP